MNAAHECPTCGHDYKSCPNCHRVGPVSVDFGYRILDGAVAAQSWCRRCRAAERQRARADAEAAPQGATA